MRICFYLDFDGGGTETATSLLANALQKEYTVLFLGTSRSKLSFAIDDISFETLTSDSIMGSIREMREFLMNHDIDVLIALEALSGIVAIPATLFTKCKLVVWEHANYFQSQGKYTQLLRKLDLLISDAYVVLTKRDLGNFQCGYKQIRTKLVQIYNMAEPASHAEYDMTSKTIISAGHIRRIKNFSIIPEVASRVFKNHPDWRWVICGGAADSEYDRLVEGINRYQLNDKVILRGRVDDMDSEYGQSAIYVMTSLQEGFPMVLLEAKAHGLPIVSFDIETGPDEIVSDGVNGYLVRPYDIDEMAIKIEKLMSDEALRISFSSNAHIGMENLTPERVSSEWIKLLEDL